MDTDAKQRDGKLSAVRRRLFAAIPVAVVVAVFAVQYVTAHTTVLTPWKGGGFGMFSTVDQSVSRLAMPYLTIDGREVPVEMPEKYDDELRILLPFPTPERSEAFAEKMLEADWVEREGAAVAVRRLEGVEPAVVQRHWTVAEDGEVTGDPVQPEAIRLEVWRLEFRADDTGGGWLTRRKLAEGYAERPADVRSTGEQE